MSSAKRSRIRTNSDLICEHCLHLDQSSDEMVVLTDHRLTTLYTNATEDTPQHRITQFAVHDSDLRFCWFDTKPIEDGNQLFVCGYVRPIVSESANDENEELRVQMIGPLQEWWFAGFDGGQKMIIGVESEFASYVLCEPNHRFEELFDKSTKKLYLTKLVIESLLADPELSYQDLVQIIEQSGQGFSQELLLSFGLFVIQQIDSFDSAAEADEALISETAAYKTLVELSGPQKECKKPVQHIRPIARIDARRAINSDTLTCSTPLVRHFFDSIFKEVIECQTKDPKSAIASKLSRNWSQLLEESTIKVNWIGKPIYEDKYVRTLYYLGLRINEFKYSSGDFVLFREDHSSRLGRIMFMFETVDKQKLCHIHYFCFGKETILSETAPDFLIFMTGNCGHIEAERIQNKVDVRLAKDMDGYPDSLGTDSYLCTKLYVRKSGRFQDLPQEVFDSDIRCVNCLTTEKSDDQKMPALEELIEERVEQSVDSESCDSNVKKYKKVVYKNQIYSIGDCALLSSDAFDIKYFDYYNCVQNKDNSTDKYDETRYPERYRKKFTDYIKGLNSDLPKTLNIGLICEIHKHISDSEDETKLLVNVFYRPQNVFHDYKDFRSCDLNLLFWSNRQTFVTIKFVRGICRVIYSEESPETDFYIETKLFYFNKVYDFEGNTFSAVDLQTADQFVEKCGSSDESKVCSQTAPKLNILDLFAGCGGLSYGFHKLGMVGQLWAIEKDESAVQSFKANFSVAKVFKEDVNHFLDLVLKGCKCDANGKRLPQKGEIDLILGGPPCQGFSGMNRFSSRHYSLFKNSLVVSFLSFIDYFRPKHLIFENVRNFSLFKNSMILKLMLSCLTRMDYQCQFAILQSGCYGLPQSRRRTVIIGAKRGCPLPHFPQISHVFSKRQCQLSVTIDDRKYSSQSTKRLGAQFRTITVDDAISDLPELLDDYSSDIVRQYKPSGSSGHTHYQKILRKECGNHLKDHYCKEVSQLCRLRIQYIPQELGSDWRDLPNICCDLSNGNTIEKLEYLYEDSKNGRSKTGQHRGVCVCAQGLQCIANECRQENTLIPWCLVHTANRQYHWSGLYGRLTLHGYFPTTVTNPEPISKQGRVIHPNQNRIVSIRESARSQGFPDHFIFVGSVADKYRQIGNAVPIPLSLALSRQFLSIG